MTTWRKQVAQLWQRDRAKVDTFPINVQRYSQTHAQNCILGSPYKGIRGNISTLSKSVNTKKLCRRVSSRECQFYRWKADSRLSIGYKWTFFTISNGWGTICSNRLLMKGWVTLGLNIRLKGYVYRQHIYTVRLPIKVFTQRNSVANFIWLNLNFIYKNDKFGFWATFWKS